MKIQYAGQRRTWSLSARTRDAAAKEALARFLGLAEPSTRRLLAKDTATSSIPRPRLLIRPHAPGGIRTTELSAYFEISGQRHYFPLSTDDPKKATRRARSIRTALQLEGLAATDARFPQERTLALEWSANPLVWTYFTVYTQPTQSQIIPTSRSSGHEGNPRLRNVSLLEVNPGLRYALIEALNLHEAFQCQQAFERSSDALAALAQDPPALLLLNQSLDGISASQFLDGLERLRSGVPSVTYVAYDDSDHVFRATPGGSEAYLLKRTSADHLLDPLAEVPATARLTKVDLAAYAFRWIQQSTGSPESLNHRPDLARLTVREREILALLSQGCLDKEIAHKLQISIWTVHGHAKSIYEKLGVHSRTEAAVRYLQK